MTILLDIVMALMIGGLLAMGAIGLLLVWLAWDRHPPWETKNETMRRILNRDGK